MGNDLKYIVYLTINLENNKGYVGVHQTEDPNVFDGYLGCGAYINKVSTYNKGKVPLHAAILKYGVKKFKRFTLKVFDKLEDALDLERWIVTEEFIKRTDTYNATIGGGLPPLLVRKIYEFDIKGTFIKEWKSESDIKRYYDCSNNMSDIVKNKRSFAGKFWSFDKVINIADYKTELNHGFISQYNKDGILLNTFKTTTLAAQKLDIKREIITQAVFKKKLCNGYYFLKADVDIAEVLSNKYKPKLQNNIYRYLKSGEYDECFKSLAETINNTKGLTSYKLKKALNDCTPCLEYYFSYKKCNNYFDIKNPNQKDIVKIAQYNKNNELIKIWDNPKDVKQEYPGALRCCQGYLKSTQGFIFKYIQCD